MHGNILLPLVLLPSFVAAQCPTATDLGEGVRVRSEAGTETLRRVNAATVSSMFEGSDGFMAESLLGQGIYLIQTLEFESGQPVPASRQTYSYELSPDAMPLPNPAAVGHRKFGGWTAKV